MDLKLLSIHPRYTYFFYHPLLHAENLEGQLMFQQKQKEYFELLSAQGHPAMKHFQGSGLKYVRSPLLSSSNTVTFALCFLVQNATSNTCTGT